PWVEALKTCGFEVAGIRSLRLDLRLTPTSPVTETHVFVLERPGSGVIASVSHTQHRERIVAGVALRTEFALAGRTFTTSNLQYVPRWSGPGAGRLALPDEGDARVLARLHDALVANGPRTGGRAITLREAGGVDGYLVRVDTAHQKAGIDAGLI